MDRSTDASGDIRPAPPLDENDLSQFAAPTPVVPMDTPWTSAVAAPTATVPSSHDHERRLSTARWIVIGATALAVVLGVAITSLIALSPGAGDAIAAPGADNAAPEPGIEVLPAAPAYWVATQAPSGEFTIRYDPQWIAQLDAQGIRDYEDEINEPGLVPIEVAGLWYGPEDDSQTLVEAYVMPSYKRGPGPQAEAIGFVDKLGENYDSTVVTDEHEVQTSAGDSGYSVELTATLDNYTYTDCVVSIVSDGAMILAYASTLESDMHCSQIAPALAHAVELTP